MYALVIKDTGNYGHSSKLTERVDMYHVIKNNAVCKSIGVMNNYCFGP